MLNFHEDMPLHFKLAIEQMNGGALYPHCPRCDGEKQVYAYTEQASDFGPGRGEYFDCPCCHATGEAEQSKAKAFIADWCFDRDIELEADA